MKILTGTILMCLIGLGVYLWGVADIASHNQHLAVILLLVQIIAFWLMTGGEDESR